LLTYSFILLLISASAQDLHWSQPASSLLYQNPAFSGIQSKFNAGINYREQWNSVNTPFKSYMASADYRFGAESLKRAALSLGGYVANNTAGDGKYSTAIQMLTMSCMIRTSEWGFISAGIAYGSVRNSIQYNSLTWGTQFDGQKYDGSRTSGELEKNLNATFEDLSAGLAYVFEEKGTSDGQKKYSRWTAGYSLSHLNQPVLSISGGTDKLYMKHTLFCTGLVPVNDRLYWEPTLLVYQQSKLNEFTIGTMLRYMPKPGNMNQTSVAGGILFRTNDAVIPTIRLASKGISYCLSYDVNISDLSGISRKKGGFEMSVRYTARGKAAN
jgi:type IX secretion system PorP/SprF family membrane protein